jgi:hypothetical protein
MVESHGLQTRRALPSGTNALWIAMAVTANIPAATAGGRRLVEVYGGLMAKTKLLATSGACSASSGRSGASPSISRSPGMSNSVDTFEPGGVRICHTPHSTSTRAYKLLLLTTRGFAIVIVTRSVSALPPSRAPPASGGPGLIGGYRPTGQRPVAPLSAATSIPTKPPIPELN